MPRPRKGLPVLHRSSSCMHAVAITPVDRKVHLSLSSFAISAFPEIMAGRLPHHVFRGLLSVHARYGLHTRQVTFMTLYTGGFSRFVTFTTAPIATGWNESCRAGFAPAGKPCPCTAHMIKDDIASIARNREFLNVLSRIAMR